MTWYTQVRVRNFMMLRVRKGNEDFLKYRLIINGSVLSLQILSKKRIIYPPTKNSHLFASFMPSHELINDEFIISRLDLYNLFF